MRNPSTLSSMPLIHFNLTEAIVKIVGLRYHYFTVPWNVFDFLLVLASILGILMEDIMIDLPISPTLLRVVRVFRIGRILRLIKVSTFCLSSLPYLVRPIVPVVVTLDPRKLPLQSESRDALCHVPIIMSSYFYRSRTVLIAVLHYG